VDPRRLTANAVMGMSCVAGLMLPACGGDDPETPDAASRPTSETSSTSSTSSSTTTQPPPTTASTVAQEPVDGTNLAACADRTCDVWVQTGDVIRFDPHFSANEFQVVTVSGEQLTFAAFDDRPSPLQGSVGGTGTVETADIRIDLIRHDGNRAFLTFRPR
jgi:hypothetical protein